MIILGLNAYHGDSSACVLADGVLIAAAEEERFRRIKHWAGFPAEAIMYCLSECGAAVTDIDHIAINRNPRANLHKKILFGLSKTPGLSQLRGRLRNAGRIRDVVNALAESCSVPRDAIHAKIHNVEHHLAHMGSSFHVSPFDTAAVVSVDGFGDFVSTMWGEGDGAHITVRDQINFPHSLGLFYLALTQYLGFPNYGDEYKVMGLAAYGAPTERANMHKIVRLREKGRFELNLDYFVHHRDGVEMVWDDGRPSVGNVFSNALTDLLGPARAPDEPIENRHRDIAASLQAAYEDAFFHLLDHVSARSQSTNLCIAGGCAMNSVANGKVFERSSFEDIYIQPAAGDAGGAIGAAYSIWSDFSGRKPDFVMDHAYFGPAYDAAEVEAAIEARSGDLAQARCVPERITDPNNLCRRVAERIAAGAVVGWFQGRMEWGPRALGNRSILADPRRSDIRELLNRKIKQRETFRPFAPSILREAVADWFEVDRDVPFMLQVFKLRKDRRELVPAITHVDGTGRLQTVTEAQNPRFYRLIREFGALTGVQMLLNTSFNENEPIVCRPEEALDCFLRTNMDVLVMGDRVLERTVEPSA